MAAHWHGEMREGLAAMAAAAALASLTLWQSKGKRTGARCRIDVIDINDISDSVAAARRVMGLLTCVLTPRLPFYRGGKEYKTGRDEISVARIMGQWRSICFVLGKLRVHADLKGSYRAPTWEAGQTALLHLSECRKGVFLTSDAARKRFWHSRTSAAARCHPGTSGSDPQFVDHSY